jgi:hypothetical protein
MKKVHRIHYDTPSKSTLLALSPALRCCDCHNVAAVLTVKVWIAPARQYLCDDCLARMYDARSDDNIARIYTCL